jgi:hypothetical protein
MKVLLKQVVEGSGVGSQLWNLLSSLGVEHTSDCPCILLADIMNTLGPDGCRKNRDKILRLLRKNQESYGWKTHFKAAYRAVVSGLAFKLNPLDPLSGLLDSAIELAEQ